jgi:hypothetical protein
MGSNSGKKEFGARLEYVCGCRRQGRRDFERLKEKKDGRIAAQTPHNLGGRRRL